MRKKSALELIPSGGFLKVTKPGVRLDGQQRSALIRKGNEFFNQGNIENAKRIFLTTGYSDGLIRIGRHYEQQDKHLEALRMYWLAPAPERRDALIERTASIVRKWLKEEERK